MSGVRLKTAFAVALSSFLFSACAIPAVAKSEGTKPQVSGSDATTEASEWQCRPAGMAAQQVEDGKWSVLSRGMGTDGDWAIMMSRNDHSEWQLVTGKSVLCQQDKGTNLVINTISSGPLTTVSAPAGSSSLMKIDESEPKTDGPEKPMKKCGPKEQALGFLKGAFRETVIFDGARAEGGGLLITASPGGKWTALVTRPDDQNAACFVAAGSRFELADSLAGKVIINNKIIEAAPKPSI